MLPSSEMMQSAVKSRMVRTATGMYDFVGDGLPVWVTSYAALLANRNKLEEMMNERMIDDE